MKNYTVLARKYRSQNFEDLIGQDVLVKTLTAAIDTGRISHAYMLTGIRGTGKTSTARIIAKTLNCIAGDKPTSKPCGVCEPCKAIAAGQHIDVIEIDAASHTGVDDVRDNILNAVQYRPATGRYKVYIIDEVHMLSSSAFNALLKTLEEPPEYVVFILATTEINKVPITILSRCQRFDLARVPANVLKKHYLEIAKKEGVKLSETAADLIARAADGSVRDGLSMLDQAISQTGGNISDESVMQMLRRADRQMITDFMKIIVSGDTAAALARADDAYGAGADMTLMLADLMEWTHWATRGKIAPASMENAPYTPDQKKQMTEIAAGASLNSLSRIWQVMTHGFAEIKAAGNPKQCFDMLVIRMINIADLPPLSAIIESRQAEAPRTQASGAAAATEAIDSAAALAQNLAADKELVLLNEWNNTEVLEFRDGAVKMHYHGTIGGFASNLAAYLAKKTGRAWNIETAKSENKPSVAGVAADKMKSDPLVADALNLFDGASVVSVK